MTRDAAKSLLACYFLGGGHDIRRRLIKLLDRGLDLSVRHGHNRHPLFLGICEKLRILHGGIKSGSQGGESGQPGRPWAR